MYAYHDTYMTHIFRIIISQLSIPSCRCTHIHDVMCTTVIYIIYFTFDIIILCVRVHVSVVLIIFSQLSSFTLLTPNSHTTASGFVYYLLRFLLVDWSKLFFWTLHGDKMWHHDLHHNVPSTLYLLAKVLVL